MVPFRIYADTSAIGGYLDPEFTDNYRWFIGDVRRGQFVLLTSGEVLIIETGRMRDLLLPRLMSRGIGAGTVEPSVAANPALKNA